MESGGKRIAFDKHNLQKVNVEIAIGFPSRIKAEASQDCSGMQYSKWVNDKKQHLEYDKITPSTGKLYACFTF